MSFSTSRSATSMVSQQSSIVRQLPQTQTRKKKARISFEDAADPLLDMQQQQWLLEEPCNVAPLKDDIPAYYGCPPGATRSGGGLMSEEDLDFCNYWAASAPNNPSSWQNQITPKRSSDLSAVTPSTLLTSSKKRLRERVDWNDRFQQLLDYKEEVSI